MKNFVVYKSGAGSGKTFTLVKEYLRLSLHDENRLLHNYRRILAVTFTNKAAAEMKSRVISALSELSQDAEAGITGRILCKELGVKPAELRRRAGIVLTHLLHHYSDFAIGTIDSFTHRIVRTFAQELDLPVNFNVELDAAGFYEKVIAQLLAKVGEDEQISRLLKEYVLNRAEDNAFWDPESGMREFTALLLKEDAGEYLEKLKQYNAGDLENFHRQFLDFIKHYRNNLKQISAKAIELISSSALSDDDFIYKKSGPQTFFKKCSAGEAGPVESQGTRLQAAMRENRWAGKGQNEEKLSGLGPALTAIAQELTDFIDKNHRYYAICEVLSKQMYGLMLLKKIEEISREQKEEERIVFISEFNNKIFNLVNEEPAPFIYERLGERYQHYLLDEFQDTSSLQWQNLLPLLDNALAGGWYNLVVGDGKQSIYRWRNANVRQFAALPEIENSGNSAVAGERAQSLKRNFDSQALNTNFRSSTTVVEFNNALFSHIKSLALNDSLLKIYESNEQKVHSSESGFVTVNTGAVAPDELGGLNCALSLQYIEAAIQDGYKYSDICVLSRRNQHGSEIAAFLVQNNIPVVSSESLLLKHNLEVNTIISYLRTLIDPRDLVSAAAVITYLFHRKRIDSQALDLYLKRLTAGLSLAAILEEAVMQPGEEDRLKNLADHCLNIIKALHMTDEAHQYVRFFLDEVNEFLVTRGPNISAFLEYWDYRKEKASLIIPDSTNAVKIMTIHASKGLEFPVVIIPYCNWPVYRMAQTWVHVDQKEVQLPVGVIKHNKQAENSGFGEQIEKEKQEQLLDNLNLLYVGLTRAVNRMHLICNKSSGQKAPLVSDWIGKYISFRTGQAEAGFYSEGAATKKSASHKKPEQNIFELEPVKFGDTADRIRIKSSFRNSGTADALRTGTLMHELLSAIDSVADITNAVEAAAGRGDFSPSEAGKVQSALHELLTRPEIAPYFAPSLHLKKEAELLTTEGDILRPDRVVFMDDTTVIIDYKTGATQATKYSAQLNRYRQALLEMGHKNVKNLLIYTDSGQVVEVK